MAEFHFIRPAWLLALIPYLVLICLLLKNNTNKKSWNRICDAELLPYILQQRGSSGKNWSAIALAIAILLAIIALAGPTLKRIPSPVFSNISGLVILLDLSRSMDATDIKPSRLIRARYKIADILRQRKDGQTALVVYAGTAFTVTPLTDDVATISNHLSTLTTAIMPNLGSNTQAALQQALALFKQSNLHKGDILFISDGGSIEQIKNELKANNNYRVSVLAVGTPDGAPIQLNGGGLLKNHAGEIIIPKLDVGQLQKIADAGGGSLQLLTTDNSDINNLTAFIERHIAYDEQENNTLLLEQWQENGVFLLLLILPLAALSFRQGILCFVFILLLPIPKNSYALEWQDLWQTDNQQAQQKFAQGQFTQATEKFKHPQWKAASQYKAKQYQQALQTLGNNKTADDWYNKGNALAQIGQLKQAISAYADALAIDPTNKDAQYNKKLLEQLQQQKQQKQQKSQPSKDNSKNGSKPKASQSNQNPQKGKPNPDNKSQQENNIDAQNQQHKQEAAHKSNKDTKNPVKKQPPKQINEAEQANNQWLKRIPDDPAGLLRRKFKYQYQQRKDRSNNAQTW